MENAINRENVSAVVDELRRVLDKSFSSSERLQIDMEAELRRLRENATSYKHTIHELEEKLKNVECEKQCSENVMNESQAKFQYRNEFLENELRMHEEEDSLHKNQCMTSAINEPQGQLEYRNGTGYEARLTDLKNELEECCQQREYWICKAAQLQESGDELKRENEKLRAILREALYEKTPIVSKSCSQLEKATQQRNDVPVHGSKLKYEKMERDIDECEQPENSTLQTQRQQEEDSRSKDRQELDQRQEEDKRDKETMEERLYWNIKEEELKKKMGHEEKQPLKRLWHELQYCE